MANNDTDDDDFPSQVEAMADRLGLTGKGRQSYIRDHMTAADYDEVPTYVKRKGDGGDGGSGDGDGGDDKSFSGRYGGRQQQQGKGKGQRQQRRGGNASWYDE